MSCVESETQETAVTKLYKEIERQVDSDLENRLTALANSRKSSIDFETVENALYEKYKSSFGSDDEGSLTHEVLFTNFDDGCDYFDDYESMIDSVSNEKSAPVKLEALQKLLECPIIDVGHKRWHRLSKNLQHCLISTNDEVFVASMRMHFKIILFPESCCEGFLSLVQGLELIFNNRCFLNKQHFLANSKLQNRAVILVKVLLKTENFVLKNLLQSKLSLFEEFLVVFFTLVSRNQEGSTLFEILSVLDSKSVWFSNLCYSLQTRNSVLKKCASVLKVAVAVFVGAKTSGRGSSKNKMEFCRQCHALHIIGEVLKYEKGRDLFPVKLSSSSSSLSVNQLFHISLTKINEPHTKNEIKELLIDFLESLSNLFQSDTLNALLEPFKISLFDLQQSYQTLEKHPHIIRILKVLCFKKPQNLLYGYHKQKPSKHLYSMISISPLQIISDLTIACVRHFINICEREHQVKEKIIELLHCCKFLYAVHPVSFLICSPEKLICCLQDFHDAIGNYKVNLHFKLDLAEILAFFFANCPSLLKNSTGKTVLLNEIFNCASEQFLMLIPTIANDEEGCEVLKNNGAKIIGGCLQKIWLEEDNIWEESFEGVLNDFLLVVQAIALNFKAFEAFFACENELTLVEGDEKPVTLSELLESGINFTEDDVCVCYVTLRVLKVLVVNADVAVFLDFTYNLQENLQEKLTKSSQELSVLKLNIAKALNFSSINISRDNSALKRRNKLSDLQQFLNKTKNGIHDNGWILHARRAFKNTIQQTYNLNVIADLTEHLSKFRKIAQFWRQEGADFVEMSLEEHLAVKKLVKLGVTSGLLSFPTQCEENLLSLLQQFYVSLNVKKKTFVGFPWIVGVVFIICSGNIEKSKKVIAMVLCRYLSIFWPNVENDDSFSEYFYKQIVVTVEDHCCGVNTVLKTAGISVGFVAKNWLQHCFLNTLPIEEICSFLMLCILFSMEYAVACVVAMFKHIKSHLFALAQNSQLHQIIEATTLADFRISNYFPLIDHISRQYKTFFCY